MMAAILLIIALGYLIGSIPFGLVLCRLAGYGDIRAIGSGNIGATNVLRTGNKLLALSTLILDSSKGAMAVGVAFLLGQSDTAFLLLAGFAAIIGHNFPVWLKFKGGKGVATTLGTLLAAAPLAGLAACAAWLITALITRISSLSALIALLSAPLTAFFFYGPLPAAICAAIALLGFIRHKDNIKRLLKGEEPKIGKKKDKG